jgi:hypothetical protein
LFVLGPGPKYGILNEKVPQQRSRMHPRSMSYLIITWGLGKQVPDRRPESPAFGQETQETQETKN